MLSCTCDAPISAQRRNPHAGDCCIAQGHHFGSSVRRQTVSCGLRNDAATDAMSTLSGPVAARGSERGSILGRAAVITTACIFGLSYSLTAALIALVLAARGLSDTLIGLNAAMHAVGVLLIAPFLPRLAARFGGRALVMASLRYCHGNQHWWRATRRTRLVA